MSETSSAGVVPNKLYDFLKLWALLLLPAIGTLYFSLAEIWGLPKADEVVRSIMSLEVFLGVVVKILAVKYNRSDERFDGEIVLSPDETGDYTNMGVKLDANAVLGKKEVLVKVKEN